MKRAGFAPALMLDVQAGPDPHLHDLLHRHPRVGSVALTSARGVLAWTEDGTGRHIFDANPRTPLRGIVELIDNNPLVCSDEFSVPSAAATLALIALGPLIEAGLVVEPPVMIVNADTEEANINAYLDPMGWSEGVVASSEAVDLGGVVAATVIGAIKTPERLEDLDDLYDERYSRSFFVRRDEDSEWHASLVLGKPHACYRLRIGSGEPHSLLTVQVMADRNGKCGAAQIVHAFNVMCGFEESLGIL